MIKFWDKDNNLRRKVKPEIKEFAKNMRKNQTPEEELLWNELSSKSLGVKFRRQAIIRGYIVDFYSPSSQIIIEVDGGYHNNTKEADAYRQIQLEKLGFVVMRFTNKQVREEMESVLNKITKRIKSNTRSNSY